MVAAARPNQLHQARSIPIDVKRIKRLGGIRADWESQPMWYSPLVVISEMYATQVAAYLISNSPSRATRARARSHNVRKRVRSFSEVRKRR